MLLCTIKKIFLFINCIDPVYTKAHALPPAQDTKLLSLNCKHESVHVNLTCLNVECLLCEVTGGAFLRSKQYQMVIVYATIIKKIFLFINYKDPVYTKAQASPSVQDTKLLPLNCIHESIHVNLTCLNVECSFCEVTGAEFSSEKQHQMVIFHATNIKKIFLFTNCMDPIKDSYRNGRNTHTDFSKI